MSTDVFCTHTTFDLLDDHGEVTIDSNGLVKISLVNKKTSKQYTHTLDLSAVPQSSDLCLKLSELNSIGQKNFFVLHIRNPYEVMSVHIVRDGETRYLKIHEKEDIRRVLLHPLSTDTDSDSDKKNAPVTQTDLDNLRKELQSALDNNKSQKYCDIMLGVMIGIMITIAFSLCVIRHFEKQHEQLRTQYQELLFINQEKFRSIDRRFYELEYPRYMDMVEKMYLFFWELLPFLPYYLRDLLVFFFVPFFSSLFVLVSLLPNKTPNKSPKKCKGRTK